MEGYLLSKLVDPFLSKLANYALSDEHTSIFKSLDNHLRLLRARSSDFMEQIERAEQSGTKKPKREVVCWLEQVQSIGKEIDALINDIQTRGFVRKFFSEGPATKLNARVSELLEQSPVSDKLVLDDHEVEFLGSSSSLSHHIFSSGMEGYLLSKLVDPFLSKLANYALSDEHTSIFKSLDNHLRLLRARSSDFMEQIERAEQSGTKKRKREVVCWLEQVQSIEKEFDALINNIQTRGFVMKFFIEGRAAELNARVSELLEKSPNFDNLVLDDHKVQGHLRPTKELVGDGFKEDFEKIWRMLVIEKVKCIGIHGMGGVGKTTLAKHINNRLVEEKQHHVVWITISEQFSIPKLQEEMARDLGIDDMSNLCDEDKRSSRLNTVLSKLKNVVLIFDDVLEKIDLIKLGDPFSIEGGKLMITTRSKQVCHQMGCSKTIDVKRLKKNEAWELFKQIHGPDLNLTSEVEIIAKSTVKKCRGLPLGIITLAGSMKGETARHAWSNVLAELEESVMGQHEMGTYVFKVLKLSFDRLGVIEKKRNGYSKSQLCFLHCSTYPEDYRIDEEELIQRFIVEGYLERKGSRKALVNEGRSILDSLVSACMLERVYSDRVKMHDLLREMALEVSYGKTKVFDGVKSSLEEEIWTGDIEKIFLWNVASGIISEMEPPNCPNLSTLRLNRDNWGPSWSLSHSFFSQMQRLSTLDVSGSGIEGLPESLSEVVSLKALLCAGCHNLRYVPNLGKLKKLKELDLSKTGIEEVHGGIEELINLKFLSFLGADELKPSGLVLNCKNIQYLLLPIKIHLQGEQQVVGLKHVEKFEGRLENMSEFIELIRNRPELDYRILVLHQPLPYAPGDVFDENSIEGNHLILCGCDFKKVGEDEEDVLISKPKISFMRVSKCEWQRKSIREDISRLCDVASLVGLKVDDDEGAEWVIWRKEEYVDTSISSSPLPLPLPHPPLFSSLTRLSIKGCKKVKKLGLLPSQFPVLEDLEIEECSEIEEIIMEVGEETRDNGINNVFLPNLKTLSLEYLPRLRRICNATMVCPSIRHISLVGCTKLKKLGLLPSQFPVLEQLFIEECSEIEEIIMEVGEETRDNGINNVFLPNLEHLYLNKLPRLKSICNATMVCPSMGYIRLWSCKELKKLPLIFGENDDSLPPDDLEIDLKEGSEEWWEALELGHPTHRRLLKPSFLG